MAARLKYLFRRSKTVARSLMAKNAWQRKIVQLQAQYPEEFERTSTHVLLKRLGLLVPLGGFHFILNAYESLRLLAMRLNSKFYFEGDGFFVELEDLKLSVTTAEEISIIIEIYLVDTYFFSSKKRLAMIDVGMNVGFASLSFARRDEIVKVYGFEPFKETYDRAILNFAYNRVLKAKIECFNYGLSDRDDLMEVDYEYENKGQVGIYGTALIKGAVTQGCKATIQLKKASTEIERIVSSDPDQNFGIKIDCEGAEYLIMKDIAENSKLLSRFSIVMIEWHEKGPTELVDLLHKAGFSVFCHQSPFKMVGMIYASR